MADEKGTPLTPENRIFVEIIQSASVRKLQEDLIEEAQKKLGDNFKLYEKARNHPLMVAEFTKLKASFDAEDKIKAQVNKDTAHLRGRDNLNAEEKKELERLQKPLVDFLNDNNRAPLSLASGIGASAAVTFDRDNPNSPLNKAKPETAYTKVMKDLNIMDPDLQRTIGSALSRDAGLELTLGFGKRVPQITNEEVEDIRKLRTSDQVDPKKINPKDLERLQKMLDKEVDITAGGIATVVTKGNEALKSLTGLSIPGVGTLGETLKKNLKTIVDAGPNGAPTAPPKETPANNAPTIEKGGR